MQRHLLTIAMGNVICVQAQAWINVNKVCFSTRQFVDYKLNDFVEEFVTMSALRLVLKHQQYQCHRHLLTTSWRAQHDSAKAARTAAPTTLGPSESSKVGQEDTYDIVINGGGIVGFSLLAALKSSPYLTNKRILLIEQQSAPKMKKPSDSPDQGNRIFSNRVFAITKGSRSLFERIGIWQNLAPFAKVVSQMYVWGDHYQNGVRFRYDQHESEMCYILENDRMIRALAEAIIQQGADVAYETSVMDVQQLPVSAGEEIRSSNSLGIHLQLTRNRSIDFGDEAEKRRTIRTSLLVGCDGFRSLVRAKSSLPYFEADLEQMGLVGTLEVDSPFPSNDTAFQRFISQTGLVVALLPLDDHHSSLVLSLPKSNLKDWMSLSEEDFVAQLNRVLVSEARSNPLDKLLTSVQSGGKPMYGTRMHPQILSIVPGSKAAFPLGFGTTLPHLVGTIKSGTPLLQTILNRDNLMDTAIIGKLFVCDEFTRFSFP